MNLGELKVPQPTQTALSAPFWEAAATGRFMLQHCGECNRWVFYPRQVCPHCWSMELSWRDGSGEATLETWSEIHRPGHPGWGPAAPYFIGIVRLEEGPTMLSHLLLTEPVLGMKLRMVPTRVGTVTLPCFGPIE